MSKNNDIISGGATVSAVHSLTIASIPKYDKPLVFDVLVTGDTFRMSIQIVIPEIFYRQERVKRSLWSRIKRNFRQEYSYNTIETRDITVIPPITDNLPFNASWVLSTNKPADETDELVIRFNQGDG